MLEAIGRIEALVSGEVRETFLSDTAKPHALAMHFIVLGESANKISKTFQAEQPDIPWARVAGLRHIIAHEYRRIDHGELWRIALHDLPALKAALPRPPRPSDIL